uniref:Uncharacterized protein n=1 Tax=Sus scrofa TaxID=9823 RepID=A0A8D1JR44_PIG
MSSNSFLVLSLGFSRYSILLSAKSDSFSISFPICFPFISFSFLIAMAKVSKTMLNNSGESGHPRLVPDLNGNTLSFFTTENDVSCGFFIYGFYYVEVGSLYAHSLESFYSEIALEYCQNSFLHLLI